MLWGLSFSSGFRFVFEFSNWQRKWCGILQEIMQEIYKSSSRELADSGEIAKTLHLTDARHAKRLLQNIENASTPSDRDFGKKAVIKAFLLFT
jgi:hypothetical protein